MSEQESEYCYRCNGSGEGMYDGSRCDTCKGLGELYLQDEDDIDDADDDTRGDD